MSSLTLPPKRNELARLIKMSRSKQLPYDPSTIPSLAGKTALITGANSGFGLATATILPTLGLSHLIIGVRSIAKSEEAMASIQKAHPNLKIDIWQLDMLSYKSVQAFARRCNTQEHIDIAILNAGLSKIEFSTSAETGHEEVIQVNYLSTALLAILLLPLLKPRRAGEEPGHLTIAGSALGHNAKFPERTANPLLPAFDKEWAGFAAGNERYSVSKTLVMMLVTTLSSHVSADQVIITNVDPGFSGDTRFSRAATGSFAVRMALGFMHWLMGRTAEQGAWTYVDTTVMRGKETHGSYLANWEIWPVHPVMYTEEGKTIMQRLWDETIKEQEPFGVKEALDAMQKL